MGQKVNPIGLRLGVNRTWDSRWYDDHNYAKLLAEDFVKPRVYTEPQALQLARMLLRDNVQQIFKL